MPRYNVTLTEDEIQELKGIIQKGGKGYHIKHAQILLYSREVRFAKLNMQFLFNLASYWI